MSTEDLPQFKPGDLIGERCKVIRVLGRGGMGEVYEAENTWTGRRVAVKVLLPGACGDSRAVGRFMQEAQAATRLAHRNIVDVLDMGRDPATGVTFLVQELLVGEPFRDRLEREQQLTVRTALDLILPVMGALAAAHQSGIVHRDVKPENVFLHQADGELVPKLIDFGLAKAAEGSQRLTHTGQILGTPLYMAPEQCEGRADIDARADVWAVGVMLYEAISGVSPFTAPSIVAVLFNVVHKPAPPIETPGVDASLSNVILRALKVPREERYASMEEFAQALLDCTALRTEADAIRERHRRSLRFLAPPTIPPVAAATMPDAPVPTANPSGTEQGWTSDKALRVEPALLDTIAQTSPPARREPRVTRKAVFGGVAMVFAVLLAVWGASRREAPVRVPASSPASDAGVVAPQPPAPIPAAPPVVVSPAAVVAVTPDAGVVLPQRVGARRARRRDNGLRPMR